jgi:membrane protease YdiL (CAAX protease family)
MSATSPLADPQPPVAADPWRGSHHFVLARMGKRLTHIGAAIPLSFGFMLLGSLVLVLPVALLLPQLLSMAFSAELPLLPGAALFTAALISQFLPIALLIWVWVAFWERRPFWTLGFEWQGAGRKYLVGFWIGVAMYGLAIGIPALFGYMAFEQGDPSREGSAALASVLLVYLGWTIQGPTEEIVCRGWLLQAIGGRYRVWLGILVSSLIFMILHGLNPNIGPIALLNLFLFGVFTCLYTLYEGGLWGVAALHASWNWVQGNLFGIEVSGNQVIGGVVINLQENGPDLITGGAFGTEGGLACTGVLLLGIALIGILIERRRRVVVPG